MDSKAIIAIVVGVVVIAVVAVVAIGMGGGGNGNGDNNYVVYHGNGGTYEGKDVVNSTTTTTLFTSLFTRDGYHCTVWNTQADGKGDTYRTDDPVKLGTHLYAQWSDSSQLISIGNMYTSKFNMVMGQKGSSDVISIDAAGKYEIPASDALIVVASVDKDVDVTVSGDSVTFKSKSSTSETTVKLSLPGATAKSFEVLNAYSGYIEFTPDEKNSLVNLNMTVSTKG